MLVDKVKAERVCVKIEVFSDQCEVQKSYNRSEGPIQIICYTLRQWFSTFGSWQPTKYNNSQFGDRYLIL